MVSVDQVVSIVKTVATGLGYPDIVVKIPNKKEENGGKGISNVSPIAQVSGRTFFRDPNSSLSKVSAKDHDRIVKMFKRGKSTKDVMEKFSYRRQQLAAIKAWITIGKY
ncbi:MAG: hypothetical protein M0Q13_11950 [Methanothrix sp.]|jgi:hypothetical protein|nr:hypothetical protein [Methanothrix sp.]